MVLSKQQQEAKDAKRRAAVNSTEKLENQNELDDIHATAHVSIEINEIENDAEWKKGGVPIATSEKKEKGDKKSKKQKAEKKSAYNVSEHRPTIRQEEFDMEVTFNLHDRSFVPFIVLDGCIVRSFRGQASKLASSTHYSRLHLRPCNCLPKITLTRK